MRVAVTGASGNVGTALLRRLAGTGVEVVGISRRTPDTSVAPYAGVRWETIDVSVPPALQRLEEVFAGVDAVVHTAWLIQPARDPAQMARVNLGGSRTVVRAVLNAGVPHLVHVSSIGAYAPHPADDLRVEESWPTTGIETSQYSREKATIETHLDLVSAEHPELLVSRVRPALVFQRAAGSEIARYFLGPFVPARGVRRVPLPVLPLPEGLRFQVVHADDLADALARIVEQTRPGAFNVADEPVLRSGDIASALHARFPVALPRALTRAVLDATYRAHVHPVQPGWLDLGLGVPVMATGRARRELGWTPAHAARDVLAELLDGIRDHAGGDSEPLRRRSTTGARTGV